MDTARPNVRCLIAWPLGGSAVGVFGAVHLVDLAEAAWRSKEGWWVVVDPGDMNDLAAWERAQEPPEPRRTNR